MRYQIFLPKTLKVYKQILYSISLNRRGNSGLGLGIKTEFLKNMIYTLACASIIKILGETKHWQPHIVSSCKGLKFTKANFSIILLYYYVA